MAKFIRKEKYAMKKLKNFWGLFGSSLAAFALVVGTLSANSACALYFHQPKVPVELNRLKK